MRALRPTYPLLFFLEFQLFVETVPSYEGIATHSEALFFLPFLVEIVPSYEGIATC